jgi:AcrR family transcriptional regulator
VPQRTAHGVAAAQGTQQQVTGRAHGEDGDHRVLARAPADPVAVPGDAVPAVAAAAQPGRGERLAEPVAVVRAQRVARLGRHRGRQRLAGAVARQQSRHVDGVVVHPVPLRPPGHLRGQVFEERVGAGEPSRQQVDPGAPVQLGAAHPVERAEPQLVGLVEERAPERGEVVRAHGTQRTADSKMRSIRRGGRRTRRFRGLRIHRCIGYVPVSSCTERRAGMTADGATGRVTRRRVRTRANLLRAAFSVFAAKGFGHVSIEEVCEAAGYSRGAFYSNFASLDELFFALYVERAELIAEQVSGALALDGPDLDVPAAVDRVTEALLLDRDWLLVKTDFLVHAARDPDVARGLLEHRARLRRAIADRLARARGHTALPAVLGDADGAAHAVVAAYDGVTTQLLLDRDVVRARAWLKQLLTALLTDGGAEPDPRGRGRGRGRSPWTPTS